MEFKRTAPAELNSETEGRLKAAFSVFDEIDSDGDIVRASAFTDGQPVPLVWAHDWSKPVGKGVVRVEGNKAVFDGSFFTDTAAGKDAYLTVKAMGELQEFSWGFQVLQSEKASHQGKTARAITKATVFEVSPVLVGANRNTGTLAIKSGEPIESQADRVLVTLEDYAARERSLADLRAKEGRAISTSRRQRIERMLASMREHADELEALLTETAPPEKAMNVDAMLAEFLAIEARLAGVQV